MIVPPWQLKPTVVFIEVGGMFMLTLKSNIKNKQAKQAFKLKINQKA
jgi:hypothetical protein